jgi:hypothetical protein
MTSPDECRFCLGSQLDTPVFEGKHFRVEYGADVPVPGWMILTLRRHVEGIWNLTAEEAASFGTTLRDLAGAIHRTTGVEKVYVSTFGERYPHFHALVSAKPLEIEGNVGADAYSGRNGPHLLTDYADFADAERAAQVGQEIGRILSAAAPV